MDYKELLIELINDITDENAVEYLYRYSLDFVIRHDSIQQTPSQFEQGCHVVSA